MKPQSKKQKGSRLEREWAQLLRAYDIDPTAKRMPLSGAFDDPRMKPDTLTQLPVHFECKNQETWKPLEYYKQATSTCGAKMPVVVMTRNREQIYVFLLGTDFLSLVKQAQKSGFMQIQYKVPARPKKLSQDDTAWQPYSKQWQLRGKRKK